MTNLGLITGASQGIGAGIAEAMAACGANVLINYISDEERTLAFAAHLSEQYNVICKTCYADISIPQQVDQMLDYMDQQLGSIDVLVNNAGIETIMDELAEITIVEKSDTHLGELVYYPLTEADKETLRNAILELIK